MEPVEGILIALGVHLGKKVIDKFWKSIDEGETPVVSQTGNIALTTTTRDGRTVVEQDFTTPRFGENELVVGDLYLPYTVSDILLGDEIALVLVIEETGKETFLFKADLDRGYEIYLPHGIYSFYIFLVDVDADDFFEAEIYAIGLPSNISLEDSEGFELENHDDIWDIVSDLPVEVTTGGPYALDFILIDTAVVPEFPDCFADLLGYPSETEIIDLTGTWKLYEEYDFGSTEGDAYLIQVGNKLHGILIISDLMDDGSETIIQESIAGEIQESSVLLYGTGVKVIQGNSDEYILDQWQGIIDDSNLMKGYSEDDEGTIGQFIMERIS